MRNTFQVEGRINSALRLFLSVPTYQQILSTIQFASNVTGETWNLSESVVNSSDTNVSPGINYEDLEEDIIPDVTAKFQMPSLQLELHGELQGKQHGF